MLCYATQSKAEKTNSHFVDFLKTVGAPFLRQSGAVGMHHEKNQRQIVQKGTAAVDF